MHEEYARTAAEKTVEQTKVGNKKFLRFIENILLYTKLLGC